MNAPALTVWWQVGMCIYGFSNFQLLLLCALHYRCCIVAWSMPFIAVIMVDVRSTRSIKWLSSTPVAPNEFPTRNRFSEGMASIALDVRRTKITERNKGNSKHLNVAQDRNLGLCWVELCSYWSTITATMMPVSVCASVLVSSQRQCGIILGRDDQWWLKTLTSGLPHSGFHVSLSS